MVGMWLSLTLLSVLAVDGGAPDAGVPPTPPKQTWSWTHADGGWMNAAGVTDVLVMRVGETAELRFPLPIVLMQCDEPLLTLGATADTLLLTAVKAGHTKCGFWFRPNAWPHRTLEVSVDATSTADAGAP